MTTIKLKNGSGAPAASDLVQGEPALDLTNKRLYTENASGTVIEVGTNPSTLTVDTDTLVVDASNNRVGVGTTSPEVLTHLKSADNTVFQLESTDATVYMKMVDSNTTGAGYIGYVTNDMTFWANNAERMRIDSSGDIGINTTSPNLHGWAKAVTLDTATNAGYELGLSGTKYGAFALQLSLIHI